MQGFNKFEFYKTIQYLQNQNLFILELNNDEQEILDQ